MRTALRLLGVALAGLTAIPATAETPSDAKSVRAALAPYLGQTLTKAMTLTPEGKGLRMGFGTKPVRVPLLGGVASLTLQPYDQLLTPNPDGTWRITSNSPPAILLSAPGTEFAVRMKSAAFEGTFDPKIMGFTASHMTAEGVEQGDKNSDPSRGNTLVTTGRSVADQTGKPGSAPGLIDLSGSKVDAYIKQTKRMGAVSTAVTAPSVSSSYSITDLRQAAILNLWQWIVAHPTPKDWARDPDEMRRLVRAVLPLFDAMQVSGSTDQIMVAAMGDVFSLDHLGYDFRSDGISSRAALSQRIEFGGLTLPWWLLPDWATPLVPSTLQVTLSASDLPLAGLTDELLASYNPGPIRAFKRGLPERLKAIFLSETREFAFDGLHVQGPTYDLTASGTLMVTTSGQPVYRAKVTMRGLGGILRQLRASADPSAQSIADYLARAQEMADVTPYGEAVWLVSGRGVGSVSVNGQPFP